MDQLQDPIFIRQLREGKCVLFVGAGLSVAAGLPQWEELLRKIAARGQNSGDAGRYLTGIEALLNKDRLLDAAELLRKGMGEASFYQALRGILQEQPVQPTATHRLLPQFRFRVIVTTNFDQLIETAYAGAIPVATHRDGKLLAKYLADEQPFVFKAHGDIDRPDTIVLANREFAQQVRDEVFQHSVSALLLTSPILFAGYSHSDMDFNLLFREHVQLFGQEGYRRYALLRVASEEERIEVELLREKCVHVVAYQEHAEVPVFFGTLLQQLQSDTATLTTAPVTEKDVALRAGKGLKNYGQVRGGVARRRVVLIPGFFGSQLSVRQGLSGEQKIWLRPARLALGAFGRLDLTRPDTASIRIRATDVLARYYAALYAKLAERYDVMLFPYDWRLDSRQVADHLSALLSEIPEGTPCDLVAHSQGGLIARAFIGGNSERWNSLRVAGTGGRLIMLGTPNHGSFAAVQLLLGDNAILKALATLDLRCPFGRPA